MATGNDRHRGRRVIADTLTIGSFSIPYSARFIHPNPARAAANWAANPGGMHFVTSLAFIPYAAPVWPACYFALMFSGPWKDD